VHQSRRRYSIWIGEDRSIVELLPWLVVTTLAPFFISVCRYSLVDPFHYPVGHISLQEGALFTEDLVIWSGRSLLEVRRFIRGVSHHSIYRLEVGFIDLVLIFKEAEILACYS
jgi:hypothetical protein